jgi:flagellar assembly factor FliW
LKPLSSLNRLKRPPVDTWPFHTELVFPQGLFGFERYTRYALIGHQKEVPFLRLEASQNRSLSFYVIDPFLHAPDYFPSIARADLEDVGVLYEAKLILFAIVNTKEHPFTMNLAAPLLIHWFKKLGKQLLMHANTEYPISYPY